MQTQGFSLDSKKTELKSSFDSVFFAPLEKLRLKWENADPSGSILFTPLGKLKSKVIKHSGATIKKHTEDEFINAESAIGRTIFGPIPAGHSREFFRDRHNIWIWHESWEELGVTKSITIRYEVREDGVYKKSEGTGYIRIEGDELYNFAEALRTYLKLCKEQLYGV